VTLRVQALYPQITGKQIHTAWTQMSEMLWRRETEQLPSAEKLLKELSNDVDVFDVKVEDGVQQLCWGMKIIGERLKGKVVEIGIDATCKLLLINARVCSYKAHRQYELQKSRAIQCHGRV
jgi:hypothetical protein